MKSSGWEVLSQTEKSLRDSGRDVKPGSVERLAQYWAKRTPFSFSEICRQIQHEHQQFQSVNLRRWY